MKKKTGIKPGQIAALIAVISISIFIFSIRDDAERLAIYGYPGIFILAFLAYATVVLPAPGLAIIFTMGSVLHPLGVALFAGAGAAFGELTAYLAGYSGQAIVERAGVYDRLTTWMKKNGPITIFLLSAIPNPIFDIAGLTAGALKMSLGKFLFWCWMGETVKMALFAFAGKEIFNLFK